MYRHLRDLREDRDLTQKQVAAYLCVSQSTYSRYEKGILDIPVISLKKLAALYHVDLVYLLEEA